MSDVGGASPGTRRIFVTDCEGPVTKNDNAQEVAERFIPDGAEFFARLSKYDDLLADVVHRPGYNAGDTLRLLPPFLKAFEVSDDDIEQFSAENVLLIPGALEALSAIRALLPVFIISTSYTPYLRALCTLAGLSMEHVRCTELSLDVWAMPEEEKAWLRDWAKVIGGQDLITIPDGAGSLADLSLSDQESVSMLDDLFWKQMEGKVCGEMLVAVHPIGGAAKLDALEDIVAEEGVSGVDVMYVGDSITDVAPLEAVRRWGGAALSFNGNAYALGAAEYAAASPDADVVAELAGEFAAGSRPALERAIRSWPKPKKGRPASGKERAWVGVVKEEFESLAEASAALRRSVRGERVARLG